jgi:transposase-like protein
MRPKGTPEQLAAGRQQGLALLVAGKSTAQVAERLGVTNRTVRRWRQEAKRPNHVLHLTALRVSAALGSPATDKQRWVANAVGFHWITESCDGRHL